MTTLLAFLLGIPTADASVVCDHRIGAALGAIDIRNSWDRIGTLLPTGSPVYSMACRPHTHWQISANLAPWYIHFQDDRLVRQWWTANVAYLPIQGESIHAGPAIVGGRAVGPSALVRWISKNRSAIEFQVIYWIGSETNVQFNGLYTFSSRQP